MVACKFSLCLGLIAVFTTSACTPNPYSSAVLSPESAIGSVTGTVLGAGVGYAIGEAVGEVTLNTLVNAGIGGGMGLIAGALLHENIAKERRQTIRQVELIDENQKNIDTLREEIDNSSTWGKAEVKSWDERYWDYSPNSPLQY